MHELKKRYPTLVVYCTPERSRCRPGHRTLYLMSSDGEVLRGMDGYGDVTIYTSEARFMGLLDSDGNAWTDWRMIDAPMPGILSGELFIPWGRKCQTIQYCGRTVEGLTKIA